MHTLSIVRANQVWALNATCIPTVKDCNLSMDGRFSWRDKVFVESTSRSVKYELVHARLATVSRCTVGNTPGFHRSHRRLYSVQIDMPTRYVN